MSRDDRCHWEEAHATHDASGSPPSPFVVEHEALLPPGIVLDVAAGTGRNAAFLAERGRRVVAVDGARSALEAVRRRAPAVAVARMDLDRPGIRRHSVDAIVCVNFLDRRLFAEMREWVRPGGVLVYDTFSIDQRDIGHPRNPDYLLRHGELLELVRGDYRVLRSREGEVVENGTRSFRAGVVAARLIPPGGIA
jgi:SAM-dependent methyltransferase